MSARKPRRQAKARLSPNRRRELSAMARKLVGQMHNTAGAVAATLKRPRTKWRTGLPDIASAAFSDGFAGFCAVYVIRNHRSTLANMQKAFLAAMRRELENRERAEGVRK